MELPTTPPGHIPQVRRPAGLQRLAVASFINQGLVLPLYLLGIPLAVYMQGMDAEDLVEAMRTQYEGLIGAGDMDQAEALARALHAHGVAVMSILALRTLVRFAGVLRMWYGHADGFHIYTSTQLLGVLLPMLIGGNIFFSPFGLGAAVLWCVLYHQHRAWWRPRGQA